MFHDLSEKFKDIAESVAGINKILEESFGKNPPLHLTRRDSKFVFISKDSILSLDEGISWIKKNMSLSDNEKDLLKKFEKSNKGSEKNYDDRLRDR